MLLRRYSDDPPGLFAVIDPVTLAVTGLARICEGTCAGSCTCLVQSHGPCAWFSTGEKKGSTMPFALACVEALTHEHWRLRVFRLGKTGALKCVHSEKINCLETRLVAYSPRDHSVAAVSDDVLARIVPKKIVCSRTTTAILTADNRVRFLLFDSYLVFATLCSHFL